MLDRPSNKKIRERKRREKEEEQNKIGKFVLSSSITVSGNEKNNKEKEPSKNNIFNFKRRVFKSKLGKSLTNLSRTESNRRSFENKKIEDSSRKKNKHQNVPGVEKEYHSAIELTNELSTSSIQNDNSC